MLSARPESGSNYVIGVFAFGDLPFRRAAASMQLFAQEVMPAFASRVEVEVEVSQR